jgi:hypothetical protein
VPKAPGVKPGERARTTISNEEEQYTMLKKCLVVGLAMALGACGAGVSPEDGGMKIAVKGLTAGEIRALIVTAQPSNVSKTLAYDPVNNVFTGAMILPAGVQTLSAVGYGWSPEDAVVATGSGTATVQANTTIAVSLVIYDQTPAAYRPDINPIVRSVSASKAQLVVNEPVTVAVDVVDPDGDAITYAWSSDCASGTFANPSDRITTWVSTAAAACTLQVQTTSRSTTVAASVAVLVFPTPGGEEQTGGINITGEYVARPQVQFVALSGPEIGTSYVYRWSANANFPVVHEGQTYTIYTSASFFTSYGTMAAGMEVDCGGTLTETYRDCPFIPGSGIICSLQYQWTTPQAGTVCKLTGSASNDGLVDIFPTGLIVR